MATAKHVAIVREGKEALAQWRNVNTDVRLDLQGAPLRHARLAGLDLSRADLRDADLIRADLSQATLTCADLTGADLTGSSLRGALLDDCVLARCHGEGGDFSQSSMSAADFRQAALSGAKFRASHIAKTSFPRADLSGADFADASLLEVDLTNCNLNDAVFDRASLTDTDFERAIIVRTSFVDVDLRRARRLNGARFWGPSHVSLGTMKLGRGTLQEDLWADLGLTQWESLLPQLYAETDTHAATLERIGQLLRARSAVSPSVFVSYSHADKAFAQRLRDALRSSGLSCWMDEDMILPGQKILSRIHDGIATVDQFLLVCSSSSLGSWWVDKEIGKIFAREERLWKEFRRETLLLIPVCLDDSLFAWGHPRADEIRERMIADFRDCCHPERFERSVKRLVEAIRSAS